jgi:hypothetical protein
LSYRKIFDMTQGEQLDDDDMMALGARIRAYAGTANMAPPAPATSDESYGRAPVRAGRRSPAARFSASHAARRG